MTTSTSHEPHAVLSTRQRHRADTHERIYDAAADEIRQHGLAGTSVARVAKAAGVSRQTVYDHFATLDDVVTEALSRYLGRVAVFQSELTPASTTLESLLSGLVDAFFAAMEHEGSRMRQEIAAQLIRGSGVHELQHDPPFSVVADAVRAAQLEGGIRTDVSADDVALVVLTGLSGFLLIERVPPAARAPQAHLAVEVMVRGLRP